MPKIECKNITVTYRNKKTKEMVQALNNLSVTFASEKFSLILGASGCGKTTLLRVIAGLEKYEGEVLYNDFDAKMIEIQNKNLAYVPQNYVLYPHMTIFDNIAYPLKITNTPRDEIIKRVNEIAAQFDLTHCLFRRPKQLSGGQQQRVAIARALIKKPQICLFDEPFANLDQETRIQERRYVKKVLSSMMSTVIFVTHNIEDAYSLADTIYVMEQGKIIAIGSPREIYHCHDQRVQDIVRID
ncbi:MAG: ABC transporter ATP-binding protein [Bacilli bacterium]